GPRSCSRPASLSWICPSPGGVGDISGSGFPEISRSHPAARDLMTILGAKIEAKDFCRPGRVTEEDRLLSGASFGRLCGVAPLEAAARPRAEGPAPPQPGRQRQAAGGRVVQEGKQGWRSCQRSWQMPIVAAQGCDLELAPF